MNAKTENKADPGKDLATQEAGKQALATRGVTMEQWRVLKEAIFPAAKSNESILMALDYCKARNLDPFKRPVHIVPVWDKEKKKLVETIWPGISELRTTAARTGAYAGKSEPDFGADIEAQLGPLKFTFPEWCKITVYRIVRGHRVGFTGVVYWIEAYGRKRDDAPNEMWRKRPRGQLAKCAEADALRSAFPEEIGGEYAAEEMSGQSITGDMANQDGVFNADAAVDGDRPERGAKEEPKDITPERGEERENPEPEPDTPSEASPEPGPVDTGPAPDTQTTAATFTMNRAIGSPGQYDTIEKWATAMKAVMKDIRTPDGLHNFWSLNAEICAEHQKDLKQAPFVADVSMYYGERSAELAAPPDDGEQA